MTHTHRFVSLLAVLLTLSWPQTAAAQVSLGVEFQVNTYTTDSQSFPWVAVGADGSSLVVWSNQSTNLRARAYDPSGAPRGGELAVNLVDNFGPPAVAARPAGFVTVWTDDADGDQGGIVGRFQDPAGNAMGLPFRVNSYTTGHQDKARVAVDAAGRFVVVWQSYGQDGGMNGVFGRRFDSAGNPLSAEFQVNTATLGNQFLPAVAIAPQGRFIVAWTDAYAHLEARRYDAQGNPETPAFAVAPAANAQNYAALALQPGGAFLVVWNSFDLDATGTHGIQARLFDASGAPRGADFQVNQFATSEQVSPSVCVDADGGFFVVWHSEGQDGDLGGAFARRIDPRGTPIGTEFQVNTYTTGIQERPTVACDPGGNALVTWAAEGQDGDSFGVFARRFGRFDPDGLEVDAKSGNGVFEPGETVEAATEWRNFMHQGVGAVTGNASAFTGPAGATYTIVDGIANYGPVGAGQGATCELFEDCFAMSVSAPATRPATHWDARFTETLSIGPAHTWLLHLGASFNDVPAASPFYRFVETVLHNGVTGGCASASYCPAAATLREQMPVLVLVAKEGAGYAPLPCQAGSERFADVPAASVFCRWIEELARRGVVSGCAANTYCPGAPVSREQMAVFVLATLEPPPYLPPACTTPGMFGDVPPSSPFCRWIEELARRGVVGGCGNGNYCPSSVVTREQVAVFVSAGFGLTLYGP